MRPECRRSGSAASLRKGGRRPHGWRRRSRARETRPVLLVVSGSVDTQMASMSRRSRSTPRRDVFSRGEDHLVVPVHEAAEFLRSRRSDKEVYRSASWPGTSVDQLFPLCARHLFRQVVHGVVWAGSARRPARMLWRSFFTSRYFQITAAIRANGAWRNRGRRPGTRAPESNRVVGRQEVQEAESRGGRRSDGGIQHPAKERRSTNPPRWSRHGRGSFCGRRGRFYQDVWRTAVARSPLR